jgi:large subunit ribosomal protein L21
MQAVFQLSGFQFTASEGDTLRVPLQKTAVGQTFDIDQILLLKEKDTTVIGTPTVAGASIKAEMLATGKGEKVTIYKYKKRTKYRRTRGHRQDYSDIKILKVVSPS